MVSRLRVIAAVCICLWASPSDRLFAQQFTADLRWTMETIAAPLQVAYNEDRRELTALIYRANELHVLRWNVDSQKEVLRRTSGHQGTALLSADGERYGVPDRDRHQFLIRRVMDDKVLHAIDPETIPSVRQKLSPAQIRARDRGWGGFSLSNSVLHGGGHVLYTWESVKGPVRRHLLGSKHAPALTDDGVLSFAVGGPPQRARVAAVTGDFRPNRKTWTLQIVDATTQKEITSLKVPARFHVGDISDDGRLVLGSYRSRWFVYRVEGDSLQPVASGAKFMPYEGTPSFSSDARYVVGPSGRGTVMICSTKTGEPVHELKHPHGSGPGHGPGMLFSQDGKMLFTISRTEDLSQPMSGRICRWDLGD